MDNHGQPLKPLGDYTFKFTSSIYIYSTEKIYCFEMLTEKWFGNFTLKGNKYYNVAPLKLSFSLSRLEYAFAGS